jgi:hypothetical protein
MAVGAAVATIGPVGGRQLDVAKVRLKPTPSPPALLAFARKWYVVPQVRFVTETEIGCDPVPVRV